MATPSYSEEPRSHPHPHPHPRPHPHRIRDGPTLDTTQYHAILVGTGFTNAIIGSALSKCEYNILHLDGANEYGSHLSSLSYDSFNKFIETNSNSASHANTNLSEELLNEWKHIAGDSEGAFEYEPFVARSSFFDASIEDFTQHQHQQHQQFDSSASDNLDGVISSQSLSAMPSSESPVAFDSPPLARRVIPTLESESRQFLIDLTPQLIFSRSRIIDLLITAGIHNYVEFKAVDSAYFASGVIPSNPPALQSLPLSKSAIFQTTALSMIDKRVLMKFMHLILGDDYHQSIDVTTEQSKALDAISDQSFLEFLKSQKLSPNLQQMVLYAVAALDDSLDSIGSSVSASVGIGRLRAYLSSVGRYGTGAFLYPNYGTSELPQAFVRLAAVNKGIFILRFQPEAIVYEKSTLENTGRKYKGVILPSGQFVTSNVLIGESILTPSSESDYDYVARAVLFLDGPLTAADGSNIAPSSSFTLLPQSTNEAPIYGLQLGWEVNVTPRGKNLVYLWTTARTLASSKHNIDRLKQTARDLSHPLSSIESHSTRPSLLAIATYQQRIPKSTNIANVNANANASTIQSQSSETPGTTRVQQQLSSSNSSHLSFTNTGSVDSSPHSIHLDPNRHSTDSCSISSHLSPPPLPNLLLSVDPLSSSLGHGFDSSLSLSESIFQLLSPTQSFQLAMKSTRIDEDQHDNDMELLEQITQTGKKEQEEVEVEVEEKEKEEAEAEDKSEDESPPKKAESRIEETSTNLSQESEDRSSSPTLTFTSHTNQ